MHPVRKREMGDTTLSYAVGNKGAEFSLAGLPSLHREHLLNKGPAIPSAGLPSPSSLRDATSPKVRGLGSPQSLQFSTLRPAAAKEPKALRGDFTPLPRAPPLGKTPSGRREMSHMRQREDSWREAPERASPAEAAQGVGLDSAYDGADCAPV